MAFPSVTLAQAAIVVGRSYEATFVVEPPVGKVAADVTTELTGATATADILDGDGATSVVANANITKTINAAARTLKLEIAAVNTAGLTPGVYRWRVYVTTSGAKQWPLEMPRAQVRALP